MARGKQITEQSDVVEEAQEQEIDYSNKVFVCVKKCFFNSMLWEVEDETGYIPGIEESPYFEME